jgi:hypothetical protein
MATARGGGGVALSDAVARSPSARGAGVFAGFGVSSSLRANLDFARFVVLLAVSLSRDFVFADSDLGVGVWCRFDFGEAVGSGVPRGVGSGVFSASLCFSDSSPASFARGIALGTSSGVADARCFFVDLLVALFTTGLGDFLGFGEDAACVSPGSD